METEFEKERKKWEAMVQGMQTTLESRAEYISGLEEKIKELEAKLENMSSENQKREEALKAEIERLNAVIEDSKKTFDENLEIERTKTIKAEEYRSIALEE